jgi:hypothetical protein
MIVVGRISSPLSAAPRANATPRRAIELPRLRRVVLAGAVSAAPRPGELELELTLAPGVVVRLAAGAAGALRKPRAERSAALAACVDRHWANSAPIDRQRRGFELKR